MSLRAMAWALDESPTWLQSTERFVLVALADHVNDNTAEAWPSIGRLMRRTGLSRAAVKRALRVLVCARIVDRHAQAAPVAGVPMSERPNLYVWHPDQAIYEGEAIGVLVGKIRSGRSVESQSTFDGMDADEALAKHLIGKSLASTNPGSTVDPGSRVDPAPVQGGPPPGSRVDLPRVQGGPLTVSEPRTRTSTPVSNLTTERRRTAATTAACSACDANGLVEIADGLVRRCDHRFPVELEANTG